MQIWIRRWFVGSADQQLGRTRRVVERIDRSALSSSGTSRESGLPIQEPETALAQLGYLRLASAGPRPAGKSQ